MNYLDSDSKFDVKKLRYEITFFVLISASISTLLIITDIVIFDNYVRPIMSECYDENNSTFCNEMRIKLEVQLGNQLMFGSKYWDVLITHFYVLGGVMCLIRIVSPVIFRPKPINASRWKRIYFIMGVIWFVGIVVWFLFGALDTGYYVLRNLEIPENLNHLNDSGLFVVVKNLFGTEDVEKGDLFFLNILGFISFAGLWAVVYFIKKKFASELSLF